MAELSTKTGTDLANEAKVMFGDVDQVQATDADWLRWINNGQREIVAVNPILQDTVLHNVTVGVSAYSYPADFIQYIQQLYYDGVPLTSYSYNEAIEYLLKEGTPTATGTPTIWYTWAQQINLYPIPDESLTNGLKIDFVRIPTDLTALGDAIDLPDRYFQTLLDYVLGRVHELDENVEMSSLKRNDFAEGLGRLSEQENKIRINSYPTITVRGEDSW